MEIEAKFAVPDRRTYDRLARLRSLAGYKLVPRGTAQVADRYFDTADGRLLAAGYACRLRAEGESVLATLKSLGGAEAAVHRRAEHEIRLPAWIPEVAAWPESDARTMARALTGGALLQPLFDLSQTRVRADGLDGDRRVAQLSVDAVRVHIGSRPIRYYEIEAELAPEGTEADLAKIVAELRDAWGLVPEGRSKFERALEAWRAYRAELASRLSADERAALDAMVTGGDLLISKRAVVVLAWADGVAPREIASRHDLSIGRVRYWLRAFRAKRTGWLGQKAADEGTDKSAKGELLAQHVNHQPSAISYQPSAISHQPSAISHQPASGFQPQPLVPDEPMSEASRKVLALHFAKMLANEEGTRLGEDIEALHNMRVATRRMRTAFQLFAPYFKAKALKPLGKGLRRTGRTLGAVRDLDVLLEKAHAFAAGLPAEQAPTFKPLLVEWRGRREIARGRLLEYLDGRPYRRFVTDFDAFVATSGAGALTVPVGDPTPIQVRHIVPQLILARYEIVRAYETVVPGPLPTMHALRIECKHLRYALEFFRDVLGPEAPTLIRQVVNMQDLLGELQDAHVAEGLLTEFLERQRDKGPRAEDVSSLSGVEAYLAAQRAKQAELLERFPAPWAELIGPDFRRALFLAVAVL
jgi:CHAD domain-containing protein